ncbi:MAG: ORF6N domain-containing protein [Bacilli bacterium]|nr:ORF6N domain-containing protein [Bacilli bacterium]
MKDLIASEKLNIENMIYEIRGKQVMLANDVAKLYNSETKIINQVVKRNINRFPEEFCFQLTSDEYMKLKEKNNEPLRSQIVTLNKSDNLIGMYAR